MARQALTLAVALLLSGAVLAARAAAQVAPVTCFGEIANVVGTDGDDELTGTDGNDVISAGGGDDLVDGLGGFDFICGGPGHDQLHGGDAWILGGEGSDEIFMDGVERSRAWAMTLSTVDRATTNSTGTKAMTRCLEVQAATSSFLVLAMMRSMEVAIPTPSSSEMTPEASPSI